MRKYGLQGIAGFMLLVMAVLFTACKDDEPTKYQMSFENAAVSGKESDANIVVTINLDKPSPENITVKYSLAGTAKSNIDAQAAGTNDAQYEIDGTYGEVDITKGESSGTITIVPYSDDVYEPTASTIEITLSSVNDENVLFDAGAKATVSLNQEDGMLVGLVWAPSTADKVADMDMFVRIAETSASPIYDGLLTGSISSGYDYNYESTFIPKTFTGAYFTGLGYQNTTYGFTYTYYAGTNDSLAFYSTFIEYTNGALEPDGQEDSFDEFYKLTNKNTYTGTNYPATVVQTMDNNGTAFLNISPITKVAGTSRVANVAPSTVVLPSKRKFRTSGKLSATAMSDDVARVLDQRFRKFAH
ncbi:MAG: hypothetical protein ABIS36_26575 [Chryseolinea sp.]